jgi:glycosyltransferase involved in cell wall biosynthesis
MPNGIDSSAYSPRHTQRAPKVREHRAIYLGRLDPQKGVDTAIRAVAETSRLSLTVVGDGRDRERLERLSQRLDVTERIFFMGQLSAPEVRSQLASADVVLLPTRRKEGLPMVLLEAAAAGIPAVTTPSASVPADILATGRVAVVPERDSRALIDATARAIRLPVGSYLPARYESDRYIAEHVHALRNLVAKAKTK